MPSPSWSNSSIMACSSSSDSSSPSSLATFLRHLRLILPELSSPTNSLNALRISSVGSRSEYFLFTRVSLAAYSDRQSQSTGSCLTLQDRILASAWGRRPSSHRTLELWGWPWARGSLCCRFFRCQRDRRLPLSPVFVPDSDIVYIRHVESVLLL